LGKTNPLNDDDLAEFVNLQKEKPETEHSWNLKVSDIPDDTCDLSPKNPNTPEEDPLRSPEEILDEMEMLDEETQELMQSIRELV